MHLDRKNAGTAYAKTEYDAAEWQLRCELAACFQLTDLYGMSDLASTHISVSLPGPQHHFLVG